MNLKKKNGYKLSCILTFFFSSLRFKVCNSLLDFLSLSQPSPMLPDLILLLFSLSPHFWFFIFLPQLSGPGSVGGQRHHQLQATSYPAAGYPCQPVWLSHREGRGKDKGDQRGEQAELKSTPSSLCSLRRRVQR